MNTPETIEHNGKTLQRLPRIEDAREGDYIELEKLHLVHDSHYPSTYMEDGSERLVVEVVKHRNVKAAYREKKEEAYPWIPVYEIQYREQVNKILTETYGSPAELMRKGMESAIELTEIEWDFLDHHCKCHSSETIFTKAIRQALANCRPKGGAK